MKINALKKKSRTYAPSLTAWKEGQSFTQSIVETMREPFLVLDGDLRVLMCNSNFLKVFHVILEETEGERIYDLGNRQWDIPRLRTLLEEIIPKKNSIEAFEVEHDFPVIGKKTMLLNARMVSHVDKNFSGILLAFEDITETRKQELLLIQAKEEAEQANRLKDKFVALVAHDLRGPLGAIMGFLSILGSEKDYHLSEKYEYFLKLMVDSSEKMLLIIDDILALSRLKTGMIVPNLCLINAYDVIENVLLLIEPLAANKKITITNEVPDDLRFYADIALFGVVIQNLLSNAVKFCRAGDRIAIVKGSKEGVVLEVHDSGIGISKNRMLNLFRLEKKSSTIGTSGEFGTGYGLPFSLDIMKAHGGNLTVESTIGEGSNFFIHLPKMKHCELVEEISPVYRK
ncbi:MAG: PAS domain-containing protein [Magnetococcales bacterium]|nr:PAS domain-containing protein [Magnetococcales bacterium]